MGMTGKAAKAAFDVVVVGSGLGGAVLANRLAHEGRSVLMVEKGESMELGLAYRLRANVLLRQNQFSDSLEAYERAIALLETYDVEGSEVLVVSELDLAKVTALSGEPERAFEMISELSEVYAGSFDLSLVLQGMREEYIAQIHDLTGATELARLHFEAALGHLRTEGNRPDLIGRVEAQLAELTP